jgi:hypothetical protein
MNVMVTVMTTMMTMGTCRSGIQTSAIRLAMNVMETVMMMTMMETEVS